MSSEGPMGFKGRLAVKEGAGTVDLSSGATYYEFLRETITSQNQIEIAQGITGDRSQRSERDRAGPYTHGGWLHFQISPGEVGNWLHWATGGTPAGSGTVTYPLATALPAFSVYIDKVTTFQGGTTSVFELRDAQIDTLVLHGLRTAQQGEGVPQPDFVNLSVLMYGLTAPTPGTQTFPAGWALGSSELYRPYEMADLVVNLLSSNREIKEFKFVLANNLFQRRVNSLNPTVIYPHGWRTVMLQVRVPNDTTNKDLYDRYPDYGAGTLTLSNPTTYGTAANSYITSVSLPAVRAPRTGPVIVHRSEIDMTYRFACRRVGTGDECTLTNKTS